MNTISEQIEKLNYENKKLQNEYENKMSDNNQQQKEYGQIVIAVKNLFSQTRHYRENNESMVDRTEDLVNKLNDIKDELRFLFELSFAYDSWEKEENKNKKK